MENQQRKALLDIGWLAGIVDGEGHITLARQVGKTSRGYYYRPMIMVGNTNPVIVSKVLEVTKQIGLPRYVLIKRAWKNEKWAINFTYQIVGLKRCELFLRTLLPYLSGKQLVAEIVLSYIEYRKQREKGTLNEHDDSYKRLIGKANQIYNTKRATLRDHTPTTVEEAVKVWSELKRELESLAEMTKPQ